MSVDLTDDDQKGDGCAETVDDDAEGGNPPTPLARGALQGLLDRRGKVVVGREGQDDQGGHDEGQQDCLEGARTNLVKVDGTKKLRPEFSSRNFIKIETV